MIELVIDPRRKDLGGFEVERLLPHARRRMVGPFVFLDHMGPADMPKGVPRSVDVRPHPHIGLSTLTYLFDGEIMHRDSVGSEQPIRPGEVNWMVAGRGITHSERFERARLEGGRLHGIQAWVGLPTEFEECDPAFVHRAESELPQSREDGVRTRVIAGRWRGESSPVPVHSPLFYAHCSAPAGARIPLPAEYAERAAYIASGTVEVDGQRFEAGRLIVFAGRDATDLLVVRDAELMLLGGEPIGTRYIEWNFVSSSRERIEQAKADWRAGRMKLPVNDENEFIPLPGNSPPPEPMS